MTDQPSAPPPRDALIVAHGAPADPAPQEEVLQALAAATAPHLPAGWRVRGATLAADGALEAALHGLTDPLIYPFFMAEGFFTGTLLPRRLTEAGATNARQTAPFGVDPALPDLMARVALAAAEGRPEDTKLLVAAHGSKVSRTSADSTHAMVAALGPLTGFNRILAGFVEEAPFLADQARALGAGICLPFFALEAGHVVGDIPEALEEAGFQGPILPPIGQHPEVPALIAAALMRAAADHPAA
ncbi:CbiX/SirB N-terminal domain-containing protein [Seohaeicola sp. SP36]|uniref:CbiX/SirB N-terminal domain-containing protein n=1 Tax=unclassified Seohaeicola TaxID=2641111 RepID=UPI00237BBACA|nr:MULTISPECIES: CbiX/SirB N-terminal domain-containing protein [unclassified Seohaeicola]MDD9707659.1 CbiX/SirB N-terminal domain-containing protein [Seohaeicola sp. 4SK31]MDD9735900.1 CbiX/SirB N-terminal domain-containing protein [Seohaeicola sp. SP36]MDF1707962.1 CbiX/SirB N-terminal domain-containing protein [Paracoccaceae bacterium]